MSSNPYSITAQESAQFQQKFTELVGNTHELLTGDKARTFFLTSGLSTDTLWKIWSLVDQEKRGKISYQQFQMAMAVIKSVRRGNPIPSFIPQEVLAASTQPMSSSFAALQQPQNPAVPTRATGSPLYNRNPSPDTSHIPAIDPNAKRKYIQQFNTLDTTRTGFVTGVQVKAAMSRSRLSNPILGQIWSLADCDKDGRLSSHEFVLAMHLIECAKLDMEMPDTLPQHLNASNPPPTLRKTPSPPEGPLASLSSLSFPTRPLSPLQPSHTTPPINVSATLPVSFSQPQPQPQPDMFQLDLSAFKPAADTSKINWGEFGPGMLTDDSVEMRKDKKLSLEDSKRENFLKGQQILQRRMSEQFQQEDRRASELLFKKKSEEKLRSDRARVEHERRRTNSIKEIKLDKERELVQIRRQQLEQERQRLNEEVDSLKSKVSSLQAEEEHLDMRKVDLESRLWHQDQFITSLKREVQTEQSRDAPVPEIQDKETLQTQVKTQTNRLASLVSRKELLKRHLKTRESAQSNHLQEHQSLSESVSHLTALLSKLKEEKSSLDARESPLNDEFAGLTQQLSRTSQQARDAKQRIHQLECKVRRKRGELDLHSVSRPGSSLVEPPADPISRQAAVQDVKFDPFEASLRSINAANANRHSNIPDLMNVFTATQPPPPRESKVIRVPAASKGTQPSLKIDSIYETAGTSLIAASPQASKRKQTDQQQQQQQHKEEIYQTSYNPIIPDDTPAPSQPKQNPRPVSVQHDTYVDSNTLMEFYADINIQKQAEKSRSSLSPVQDNIHYEASPRRRSQSSDKETKPIRPTNYPAKSSLEPVPSTTTAATKATQRLSALYNFDSSEEGVLSFKKGDMFSWRPEFDGPDDGWMGAEVNGKTGIVPESYVQKLQSRTAPPVPVPYGDPNQNAGKTESQPAQPAQPVEELYAQPQKYLTKSQLENEPESVSVEPYQVEAKVGYKARIAEQISFEKGAVITVTKEKTQSKWLYGTVGSSSGWFPKFSVVQIPKSTGAKKPQPKAVAALAVGRKHQLFDDSFERTFEVSKETKPVLDISSALNKVLGGEEKKDEIEKKIKDSPKSQDKIDESEMYLALFDFNGTQKGDLVFKKNDNIRISRKHDDWLYGECNGKSGYLPANYVAKISQRQPSADAEESPIYDNIAIPIAPKRIISTPASHTPDSPTDLPTRRRSVHELKNRLEQTNTVYTASVEMKSDVPVPTVSKSQPTNPFPQAAPRSTHLSHSNPPPTSASVDTSQEELSIAPFTTTASMRFKQRGGSFSFQAGDRLYITRSRANGKWFYGKVESSGSSGWFPCSFVPTKQPEPPTRPPPPPSSVAEQAPTSRSPSPQVGSYYEAIYDYYQAYNEDLSFKSGDLIQLVAVDGEWATGELDGKRGYFPFKYVKKSLGPKYSAVFAYTAQNDDEISFLKGDVITFISKSTEYWWSGELNGKIGLFPANNVQEVREAFVESGTQSLEKEMEFVITEIVSSELAYLNDLHLVDELVFQPIEKNRLLTQVEQKQIMVNWRELIAVSRRMVEGMETDPQDPKKSFTLMTNLFHSHVSYFQQFVTWCANQSNAITLLQKKLEGDVSIRELQSMWNQDPRTTYLPISSFMLKPMQRVTKYQLFIKRLLELCPSGDGTLRSKIEVSLSELEKICLQANEGVRLEENKTKVEWVLKHVEFVENEAICKNILCGQGEGDRRLVYTGKLVKTNSNKELIGFLFNDLLLLTRASKNLFQRHTSTSDLFEDDETKLINYRCPYKFTNMVSVKQCMGDECCFLLEVFDSLENQIRSLQLRAEGVPSCKNWLKLLNEGIERCQEHKLFEVSTDVGGGIAEALRSDYTQPYATRDVNLII